MAESENVFFKKLPEGKEIESFFSSIYKTCTNMLSVEQLDKKINDLCNINIEENNNSSLNTVIDETLETILTSIISKLFTAINRHILPPYSNELSSNISEVFDNCRKLQKNIFANNENNFIGILVFGILASKLIRFQKQIIGSDNYIPEDGYIQWYYGKYDTIIEIINIEYDDIYWMDSAISWIGYNKEPIVAIIIESSSNNNQEDLNILRAYIKSISSFIYIDEVKQYIIITKQKPPDTYIENNLIDTKNIYYIE